MNLIGEIGNSAGIGLRLNSRPIEIRNFPDLIFFLECCPIERYLHNGRDNIETTRTETDNETRTRKTIILPSAVVFLAGDDAVDAVELATAVD